MRLHHIDSEMNVRTKNQDYIEHHLQLHYCVPSVELLQLHDLKSPPTQEMVAVWTSFYDNIARLYKHLIGTGILDSRILNSPPLLRIYLNPYASSPTWSRTSQICGFLHWIMEYPDKG